MDARCLAAFPDLSRRRPVAGCAPDGLHFTGAWRRAGRPAPRGATNTTENYRNLWLSAGHGGQRKSNGTQPNSEPAQIPGNQGLWRPNENLLKRWNRSRFVEIVCCQLTLRHLRVSSCRVS